MGYPNSMSSVRTGPLSSPGRTVPRGPATVIPFPQPKPKPKPHVPFKPNPNARPKARPVRKPAAPKKSPGQRSPVRPGGSPAAKPVAPSPAAPKFNPRSLPMIARPDWRTGPLGGAFAIGFNIGLWVFAPRPGSPPEIAPVGGQTYLPPGANWHLYSWGDGLTNEWDRDYVHYDMVRAANFYPPDVPLGQQPVYAPIGEQAGIGPWEDYQITNWISYWNRSRWAAAQSIRAGMIEVWQKDQGTVTDPAKFPRRIAAGDPIPGTGSEAYTVPNYISVHPFAKPWIWPAFNPGLIPIHPTPTPGYSPKPIARPFEMPEPWSPQAPDVGPVPGGNPWTNPGTQPGTNPGEQPGSNPNPGGSPAPGGNVITQPVPEGLPEAFPEFSFKPVPHVGRATFNGRLPQIRNSNFHRPQRPKKRNKETKARMHPILGFLWSTFSPITETVDLIDVLYECQPKATKRREYERRGRQPNPFERAQIIYRDINTLDVGCAVSGYIENQIEDMMYSIGGKQLADANRKLNRPIGFEAGGGLSGYRPHVSISGL